jgi:hypothetical protein
MAVGALGLSLFIRDFATGQIAWGVTSQFPILFSHRSNAFLRVNRLMEFATRLYADLHAGSLVSCHNFLSLRFCFNRNSNPGLSLFRVESLILLVDSLYAEATEAVKLHAALSASSPELMSILSDIKSEARLWNCSQSVNFSTGSEIFLVLPWSSMWKHVYVQYIYGLCQSRLRTADHALPSVA